MRVRRLFLKFGTSDVALIDIVTPCVLPKGTWALSARSGSGKTSLFHLISGWFDDPLFSTLSRIADVDWDPLGEVDVVGNEPSLLPWKSVDANIRLRAPIAQTCEILETIQAVGLEPSVLGRMPFELSYGMYKRVEFVAALLGKRRLLLLDEFFASLDYDSRQRCFNLVQIRRNAEVTILSTHSPDSLPRFELGTMRLVRSVDQATIKGIEFVDSV